MEKENINSRPFGLYLLRIKRSFSTVNPQSSSPATMKAVILLLALLVLVANARPPPKCDPFVEYCRPFKAGPWLTPPFRPPTANVPRYVRPPGCKDGILSEDCFPF
uniref:Uncharacterized protein n=1 Tax=Steinernema glaseri TaxID=37863 RepID=A0A1I7Z8E0_9BILA